MYHHGVCPDYSWEPVQPPPIDELATEVGRLTKGLDSIRGELAHFEKEAAKTADDGERVGERFAAVMAPFAESAAQQLEELRRAEAAMVEAVDGARTYFAEEAKVTTDEFFSRLSTFVTHLETAAANEVQDLKKQEHAARSTKRRRGGKLPMFENLEIQDWRFRPQLRLRHG